MAINPNIALSGRPLVLPKAPDPLDQYSKFAAIRNAMLDQERQNTLAPLQIEAARNQNRLAQQQFDKGMREEEQNKNFLADLANAKTPDAVVSTLNRYGKTRESVDYLKGQYDIGKAKTDEKAALVDLRDKAMEQSRVFLETLDPNDPQVHYKYLQWHEGNHADPVLGPMLKERGITAEQARANIEAAIERGPQAFAELLNQSKLGLKKFMEMNKAQHVSRDIGGTVQEGAFSPATGTTNWGASATKTLPPQAPDPLVKQYEYAKTPEGGGFKGSLEEWKRAGTASTNVNVDVAGPKAYGQAVGKTAGETDAKTYDTLTQAPANIAKMDETLGVLRNQDVNTGLLSELNTVIDKARGQYLNDQKAGKRVTSTEYLDTLLGSEVFPQISALGIGARGLDTPAEREFLRTVMTGTLPLNKDTLIKMTELRRKTMADQVEKFNKEVDSGRWNNFFEGTGYPKKKIGIPKASVPRTMVRSGTLDGKRVVEYSDGSIEYAQ